MRNKRAKNKGKHVGPICSQGEDEEAYDLPAPLTPIITITLPTKRSRRYINS